MQYFTTLHAFTVQFYNHTQEPHAAFSSLVLYFDIKLKKYLSLKEHSAHRDFILENIIKSITDNRVLLYISIHKQMLVVSLLKAYNQLISSINPFMTYML